MRPAVAPLVLIWLGLHVVVLAVLLAAKFAGLKLMLVVLLLTSAIWFLARQPARLMLPHRRMV